MPDSALALTRFPRIGPSYWWRSGGLNYRLNALAPLIKSLIYIQLWIVGFEGRQ
jgi:hypothetical protein